MWVAETLIAAPPVEIGPIVAVRKCSSRANRGEIAVVEVPVSTANRSTWIGTRISGCAPPARRNFVRETEEMLAGSENIVWCYLQDAKKAALLKKSERDSAFVTFKH